MNGWQIETLVIIAFFVVGALIFIACICWYMRSTEYKRLVVKDKRQKLYRAQRNYDNAVAAETTPLSPV